MHDILIDIDAGECVRCHMPWVGLQAVRSRYKAYIDYKEFKICALCIYCWKELSRIQQLQYYARLLENRIGNWADIQNAVLRQEAWCDASPTRLVNLRYYDDMPPKPLGYSSWSETLNEIGK